MHLAGHERQAHAGHRVHAEHAHDPDMRVTGTHQYDILQDRRLRDLHLARSVPT
jgi:hypothetical protein